MISTVQISSLMNKHLIPLLQAYCTINIKINLLDETYKSLSCRLIWRWQQAKLPSTLFAEPSTICHWLPP